MGVVSCCIGGLVVAHVGRRLLLGRTPRQCAMSHHNDNSSLRWSPTESNSMRRVTIACTTASLVHLFIILGVWISFLEGDKKGEKHQFGNSTKKIGGRKIGIPLKG